MMTIDIHIHPLVKEACEMEPRLFEWQREIYGLTTSPQPLDTLVSQLEEAEVKKAILLALDCRSRWGCCIPSNNIVAKIVAKEPDLFIGFASVDPGLGEKAIDELKYAIKNLGLQGVKLNPALQDFDPLSPSAERLYAEIERLEVPLLVHTGLVWSRKHRIKYCNPLVWDEIAYNHPTMKIILAHCGWPWVWDAVAVALRHENVYLDISNTFTGTPREHLRHLLTELIPSRVTERFLGEKILFGSDYPRIEVPKMVDAAKSLSIDADVIRRILHFNALEVLFK